MLKRLLLLAYLILGVVYAVSAPIMETSDEPRHVAMVQWLAQGKGLPIQDPNQHGPYEQEGSQPPLYYWAMAGVAQVFDRSDYDQVWVFNPHSGSMGQPAATTNRNQMLHDPVRESFPWQKTTLALMVMRLLGVLMGGVAVWCTWHIAHAWLAAQSPNPPSPISNAIPLLAAALTAFNPMFLHIMASVNNDTMAVMFGSLALALGADMIWRGITWRKALALGVALGCAALTKASGLALALVVPGCVVGHALFGDSPRRAGEGKPRPYLFSLFMVVPAAAIAGWWYIRNGLLYGDITGTQMMAQIAGARPVPATIFELAREWGSFLWAYWGLFGALNIAMPVWVYWAFEGLWVVAGIGLFIVLARWWRGGNKLAAQHWIGAMLFAAFAVAFVALLRWSSLTLASQGRLLFPVIAAISVLTALGVSVGAGLAPVPKPKRALTSARTWADGTGASPAPTIIAALIFILACVVPFAYIRPAYARPALLNNEAELPADLHKTELLFEDKIRWIGYTVDRSRITQPDREVNVTLYWQALRPISQTLSLGLRLYGRDEVTNTQLLVLDTFPGGGMWPTTLWQPGQIIADRYRLRVGELQSVTAQLPTVIQLDVAFYRDLNGRDFITDTRTPSGEPAPRQFYPIAGLAAPTASTQPTKAIAQLSHAELVTVTTTQNGSRIRLETQWRCTQDIGEDYTMFVQLFAEGGDKPVKQADGPIEQMPLRWWRVGDGVKDIRAVDVSGLAAGTYTLKLGFYKPVEPYERMAVIVPASPEQAIEVRVEVQ